MHPTKDDKRALDALLLTSIGIFLRNIVDALKYEDEEPWEAMW